MNIMILFRRIIAKIVKTLWYGRTYPYNEAKRLGVKFGDNCRFIGTPRWGSEPWLIEIGNHVELSFDVTFITHDGATWVFRDQDRYKNVIRYGKIIIEDNCFIGAMTTILPGVTIGRNSIIGACSLVNSDIKPDSVYAGVPAKRICSTAEYAEKCLDQTPNYDRSAYQRNKKKVLMEILNGKE